MEKQEVILTKCNFQLPLLHSFEFEMLRTTISHTDHDNLVILSSATHGCLMGFKGGKPVFIVWATFEKHLLLNHANVLVWSAGGQLRSGLRSVLRDEAPHLWGRGQCQMNKMQTVRTHLLLIGDYKHNSATEPKLPRHLQRRRHVRLPR